LKKSCCIITLCVILILSFSFLGCGNDSLLTNYDVTFSSYCAKEINERNIIMFEYPLFETQSNSYEKINELIITTIEQSLSDVLNADFQGNIKDFPENLEWDNSDYSQYVLDVNYTVTRNDSKYLSIVFEGFFNYKNAAHPINYFNSLIIDIENENIINLSDLFIVDINFITIVRQTFKEQIRNGLAERNDVSVDDISEVVEDGMSYLSDEELLETLKKSNIGNNYGFNSYLTETQLGISIPLSHAVGDHFEILVSYDKLEELMQRK